MPLPIKKYLAERLSAFYSAVINAKAQMLLSQIKNKANVFIHDSFELGDTNFINVNGDIKKLCINENFTWRRSCNIYLHNDASLTINRNVFLNNYCSINCLGNIEIGENTIFGEGVKIYDHNHLYSKAGELKVERDKFKIGKVVIGKNCWIGSNVIILNNVSIGDNVIIGANCLINKSIPANCIVKSKTELIIE